MFPTPLVEEFREFWRGLMAWSIRKNEISGGPSFNNSQGTARAWTYEEGTGVMAPQRSSVWLR